MCASRPISPRPRPSPAASIRPGSTARDQEGVTLRDALVRFGGDPAGIAALARDPARYRGYLEVHIEQGPLLEAEDLPVGIVSAINGITRARATVIGEAGHAGTVPMAMRRDALAAVAEMIGIVERAGATRTDTVATVGVAQVQPGAINVIPGAGRFHPRCPLAGRCGAPRHGARTS